MADNKRQKEDFTTALKKQVGKVVPAKPARARETLRYTTDQGVEIEIVRGDESDAQWNALKKKVIADQQAAAAKSDKETQQNERDRAWQALNNPKSQFAPELGIDEKTRNALLQMDPDKAIDFVLARSRNAGRQRDLAKKSEEPKPVAQEKPVAAPAPKRSGGTGTQTEDTLTVGSAEPGMSVRGNMARLMLGATGEQSSPEDARVVGPKERLAIESGAPPESVAEGQRLDAENPRINYSPTETFKENVRGLAGMVDAAPGAIADAAGVVKQGLQVYPAVVGYGAGKVAEGVGEALGMPNLQGFGERLAGTSTRVGAEALEPAAPAVPAAQGVAPATPAPSGHTPEQLAAQQQGAAMNLAATMPGGFRVAQADPEAQKKLDAAVAAHASSTDAAKGAIQREADLLKTESEAAFNLNQQKMAEGEALASEAAQIRQTHANEAARQNAARMATLAAAREAASQPTDPNRFWNNKSDGQKAMSVIAGALFGFTGQGMQWLQRLDSLVEQDVRMQQADRAARVQGLRDEAQGLGEAAQFAMQQGATLAEAKLIERQAKYESARAALETLAARTQNAQVQMRAQEMITALDAKQVDLAQQGLQLAQMNANNINTARYHNAQLQQEKVKMGVSLAGGADGRKLEQLRGPQVQNINDVMDAIQSAKNMSAEFKQKASGLLSKLYALDPTGTTAASEYNAKRDVVVQLVGRALEGGVLREGDISRYQKMIPAAGDLRGAERWNQLIKELEQRLVTGITGFRGAGFDVGTLPQQAARVLAPQEE